MQLAQENWQEKHSKTQFWSKGVVRPVCSRCAQSAQSAQCAHGLLSVCSAQLADASYLLFPIISPEIIMIGNNRIWFCWCPMHRRCTTFISSLLTFSGLVTKQLDSASWKYILLSWCTQATGTQASTYLPVYLQSWKSCTDLYRHLPVRTGTYQYVFHIFVYIRQYTWYIYVRTPDIHVYTRFWGNATGKLPTCHSHS